MNPSPGMANRAACWNILLLLVYPIYNPYLRQQEFQGCCSLPSAAHSIHINVEPHQNRKVPILKAKETSILGLGTAA